MRYFNRTAMMSKVCFILAILFFIISILILFQGQVWDQVILYSNGNSIGAAVFFLFFFLLSAVLCIVAIALRCIVKDAQEELDSIHLPASSEKKTK